jgi:hypothetical protein
MGRAPDEVDDVGPVDFLVVEFARGRSTFSGELAAELSRLSEEGLIRVLDLLVIQKAFDGSVEGFEVQDVGCDEIGPLESDLVDLLSTDDVDRLSAAMEPGSVAGVVVWENLWAAPFASAARRAGGQLIATGRIPIQDIVTSLEADEGSQ